MVAELANPYMSHGELKAVIAEKAGRTYEIPFSKKTSITEGCIKKWLALYRRHGEAGLLPKVRADKGFSRVLQQTERDALIAYLSEHPELTARAVYRKLAFIDDATRRIVFAEFGTSERSLAFEKGLKHILSTHGRIGRAYVDNGFTFVSTQTQRILDKIGRAHV